MILILEPGGQLGGPITRRWLEYGRAARICLPPQGMYGLTLALWEQAAQATAPFS